MATHSLQTLLYLNSCYSESGRYYHNINHIKFLLSKLNEWMDSVQSKRNDCIKIYDLTRDAIWWHDAWYSIWDSPGENERQSAELYLIFSKTKNISDITEEEQLIVKNAILRTKDHLQWQTFNEGFVSNMVAQLMLDVDLVGFAKDYESVKWDSENVIKEYEPKGLSREKLLKGRIDFLTKLKDRERIFYTDYFFEKYELLARYNITISIQDAINELVNITKNNKICEIEKPGKPNPRKFINHAGLRGIVTQNVRETYDETHNDKLWILEYNDGSVWYVNSLEGLTIQDKQ